mgnify:CR=1 FL=1|tara:strand:+ start:16984 stop:18132 length:1149 start_codon:yes stop_codon:yes gene_type:complete
MGEEPQIELLSQRRRKLLFLSLVAVFLVALPSMIFYTTGYRLSFENDATSIVTTGGMYVTTDNLEVDVYLDEELVESPRLFQSAYYLQRVEEGKHRVVVQRSDLQTWVKDLPVDPRIVTEAAAFNMPLLPHVRPITEFVTEEDVPVFVGVASGTDMFPLATSTIPFVATSTTATSTFALNEEFIFVESLFSTTSSSTQSVFERMLEEVERFRFATTTVATATEVVEEKVESGDLQLVEHDLDIYAVWNGEDKNIPYYFCISSQAGSTTAERYGEHVAVAFEEQALSTTTTIIIDSDRFCRREIKLDRLRQDVFFYDFFPINSDLVLLQLEDGLYVTEIDDRAWQNTQLLYPGDSIRVVTENNSIFIKEDDRYFELITQIEPE